MKICIVSLITQEIEDFYISILNKKFYCEKNNYTFVNYNERMSKRHCPWDKILCLIKTINWFDYIIWIDADAIINNIDIKFEDIINENPEKDLLICKDPCFSVSAPHCMINTGVMIFKNSKISIDLLNDTWNIQNDYSIEKLDKYSYEGYPHEQGALANLLRTKKYENCFYLYEQAKFNTHPNYYNKNTFIVHYMGSRQNDTKRKEFIENVFKINNNHNNNESNYYFTKNNTFKFAITTMYTKNIESYASISTKNKEWYSKKYNIDLLVTKDRQSQRHPAWDKIQCVLKAMENKMYDYIIWMDADAIFLNNNIDFNTIVNIYPYKNFIVCNDPYNNGIEKLDDSINFKNLGNLHIINTGVFIIKNTDEMKNLLIELWNTESNTNIGTYNNKKTIFLESCIHNWDDWPYEQGPFHILFSKRNDMEILPDKAFNTIPHKTHENSFILHNMGGRMNEANMINLFLDINKRLKIDN
jgi:hypothetical protein